MKNELSSLTISNAKLVNDLKNLNSLEEQLKKVNDENHKLSSEMLELSIDGGVLHAPKFIVTATLFKFMTLGNMLLCHKDKVRI